MTKKQNPKFENSKAKRSSSEGSDRKDILKIAEGYNWKPVKRSGRFINANYPPENMSQEELERFWGEPTPEDMEWAKSLKNRVVKER